MKSVWCEKSLILSNTSGSFLRIQTILGSAYEAPIR